MDKIIFHRCSVCGEHKEATTDNFHKNRGGRRGLSATCRPCRNEYMRQQRRLQKANKNTNQEEI